MALTIRPAGIGLLKDGEEDTDENHYRAAEEEHEYEREVLRVAIRAALDATQQAVREEFVDGSVSAEEAAYNHALDDAILAIEALKG